jgi:hypothetical protein
VLISYIAPSDVTSSGGIDRRIAGAPLNRYMLDVAYKRGRMMYDPWGNYRTTKNGWTDGASKDRIHPVPKVSKAASDRLEAYIRQAVEGA